MDAVLNEKDFEAILEKVQGSEQGDKMTTLNCERIYEEAQHYDAKKKGLVTGAQRKGGSGMEYILKRFTGDDTGNIHVFKKDAKESVCTKVDVDQCECIKVPDHRRLKNAIMRDIYIRDRATKCDFVCGIEKRKLDFAQYEAYLKKDEFDRVLMEDELLDVCAKIGWPVCGDCMQVIYKDPDKPVK